MNPSTESTLRLVINVEGHRADAAILQGSSILASSSIQGNPVESLAPVLRDVLSDSGLKPADLKTWIYSGGPGSLLGLRSLAMLLSTWEVSNESCSISKYRFSGMVWTARELQRNRPGEPFLLISPWRTNAWNLLPVDTKAAAESELEVFEGTPAASPGTLIFVLGGRLRTDPPEGTRPVDFPAFETLIHHLDTDHFLVPTERIEPLQSGTTEYRKWTPAPLPS